MATQEEIDRILATAEERLGERERAVKAREEALSEGGPKTLRDYFAGQALMGLLANPKDLKEGNEEGWSWRTGSLAGDAYLFADQMLEARLK